MLKPITFLSAAICLMQSATLAENNTARRPANASIEAAKRADAAKKPQSPPRAIPSPAGQSPVGALTAYISAARSANRMEDIFRYLPNGERKSLIDYQATYKPEQAKKNREWHQKQNPKIDAESLKFLSNPPFVNELARHKRIANKYLGILDVEVDGKKAVVEVSTTNQAMINGGKYGCSRAKFDMVFEGGTWRVERHNDGNVYYQEPPSPPNTPEAK